MITSSSQSSQRREFGPPVPVKTVIEQHLDCFVAYPLGLNGVVVGEGDTNDDAMTDVRSAIRFHIETFGPDMLDQESPVIEAFVTEAEVARRQNQRMKNPKRLPK